MNGSAQWWQGGGTGRLTGIDRDVFEAIVARVDELAEEAERLADVVANRHVGEAADATLDEWRSSARFVYELSRAALETEAAALALHADSVRRLYAEVGVALELERLVQF